MGSALGLFSSAIPKVMDMWQDKNDKAHGLALLKAQAEITLDQPVIDASIREVESIHEHDSNIKGSTWVKNTRALVRPIMAELNPYMFAVLCSWTYNLGTGALQRSSLRRLYLNEGRYEEAADEFLRWVFCNGKRLRGLVLRRTDERALFLA